MRTEEKVKANSDYPYYTGTHPHPHGPPGYDPAGHHHGHPAPGFCASCCHPRSKCCCGCHECRKEAKELLVLPDLKAGDVTNKRADVQFDRKLRTAEAFFAAGMPDVLQPTQKSAGNAQSAAKAEAIRSPFIGVEAVTARELTLGLGTAFIGGGCCVHLSIEYTPSSPTVTSAVVVLATGADDTLLAWGKVEQPGTGYQVKECIVTTKPGADLAVVVLDMTARVRWCEVFSC